MIIMSPVLSGVCYCSLMRAALMQILPLLISWKEKESKYETKKYSLGEIDWDKHESFEN